MARREMRRAIGCPSRTVTGEGHYKAGPCDQFRTARFLFENAPPPHPRCGAFALHGFTRVRCTPTTNHRRKRTSLSNPRIDSSTNVLGSGTMTPTIRNSGRKLMSAAPLVKICQPFVVPLTAPM